jgi:hypothetical protein
MFYPKARTTACRFFSEKREGQQKNPISKIETAPLFLQKSFTYASKVSSHHQKLTLSFLKTSKAIYQYSKPHSKNQQFTPPKIM